MSCNNVDKKIEMFYWGGANFPPYTTLAPRLILSWANAQKYFEIQNEHVFRNHDNNKIYLLLLNQIKFDLLITVYKSMCKLHLLKVC